MKLSPSSSVLLESIVFQESNFSHMAKKVALKGPKEEDGAEVARIIFVPLSVGCDRFYLPRWGKLQGSQLFGQLMQSISLGAGGSRFRIHINFEKMVS